MAANCTCWKSHPIPINLIPSSIAIKPESQEDASNAGKKDFVNVKRTVWHTAFYEIVKSIEQYTETGTSVFCGDKITRQIFPRVLFISADYEEQYVVPCKLLC